MQKKSFFIKDILQKLNEDEKSKINYLNQNNQQFSVDNLKDASQIENKKNFTDFSNLKFNIESNNLLSNWQSLAMAAMSQNNTLNNKNFLSTNEINKQNFNYFKNLDQSTLSNYFQFHNFANANSQNYLKNSFNCIINDLDLSENSNNSFNCESSKFIDSDSDIDCESGKSTPISIENCDEEINSLTIRNSLSSSEENKNYDKKLSDWRKEERKKKRKNRRNRTVFTELQLMGLERRFDSQKYLSTPDRAELANALGLSQLQVKTWYQNRRMKWKKQVMQGGCMVAPTKPKGRPKKNSIPSLGLIFDTSSLLSAVEARKNLQLASRDLNSKLKSDLNFNNYINLNKKNDSFIEQNSVKNSLLNESVACSSIDQNSKNLVTDTNHKQAISRQFLSELEFSAKKAKLLIF